VKALLSPARGPALATVLVVFGAGSAAAQVRPLLTEPAPTAPAGTLVVEMGFDVIAAEPSFVTGVERTRWEAPLLRLVYSPAGDVELGCEWVARVGVVGEKGRGDFQSSDWGDVTLRAKWRMVEGRGGHPTIGARFGVVLPQTSFEDKQFNPLGLGPNTIRAFLQGVLTQPVGGGRIHLDAGLLLFDEVYRLHDQRDFLSYGLAFEWPATPRLVLVAEVAGRAGDGGRGAEPSSEARAGLRLGRGRLRWDVALRRGLAHADGSWGATAGLTWDARPATPRTHAAP
jgi:hypothetical protein